MSGSSRRPSRRIGPFAVAVVAALALSACASAGDPAEVTAEVTDFEHALFDIVGDLAAFRGEFALTINVPGEWTGRRVLDDPSVVVASFVTTDDGPRAVAVEYGDDSRYALSSLIDGSWQRPPAWIDGPVEWGDVSSFVSLGNDVIAVGPRGVVSVGKGNVVLGPFDQPWSFVVGADAALRRTSTDGTSKVTVRNAATGNDAVMAIGRHDGRATAWLTTDAIEWSEVSLPIEASYRLDLKDLLFVDGRWIIVAKHTAKQSDPQQLVVMTSGDGEHWQRTTLEPPSAGVEALKRVILGHDGSNVQVLGYGWSNGTVDYADQGWAVDDGFTWASEDGATWGPPLTMATGTFGNLYPGFVGQPTPDGTVLISTTRHQSSHRYRCLETDKPCQSTGAVLWVPEGGTWPMLVPPVDDPLPQAAAIIDNVLYLGRGPNVYQWSPQTGDQLPPADAIDIPPPPEMALPLATKGPLEGEVVYATSLRPWYPDDGRAVIDCVRLDDRSWGLSAVAPGAIDILRKSDTVASGQLFGTVQLVQHDRIEFAIPGFGPIAYLEPRSTGGPWGDCRSGSTK